MPSQAPRYFVTILANTSDALRRLAELDLDVFQATARGDERGECSIEGLVTMKEVERLVEAGYRVLVKEESSTRARARSETVNFAQWVREMGA